MSNYSAMIAHSDIKLTAAEVAKRLSTDTNLRDCSEPSKVSGMLPIALLFSLYTVLATTLMIAV